MSASDDPAGPMPNSGAGLSRNADWRRARRERARRRARRRQLSSLALAAVLSVAAALSIHGIRGGSSAVPRRAPASALRISVVGAARAVRRATRAHLAAHRRPPVLTPASLPQTHVYPSGNSAHFKWLMSRLWDGIVRDSPTRASPAFFPEGAYVQLKAIDSASSDWKDRLVHDYGLDIAAAHALLGRDASRARLVEVDVPSSFGHWIQPGVCDNRVGYYEMPNARVVFRDEGGTRSFGIASMISWRGVWYVVHLGAILRPTDTGVVDDPERGPGTPAYSGTC